MANIRIEEKKGGTAIWPWIVGLLVLGLVIWGITELFDEADEPGIEEVGIVDNDVDDNTAAYTNTDADDSAYRNSVAAYMDYTADMQGEMGLDHEFSHRALTLLANASASLAEYKEQDGNSDARTKAAKVRQLADEITRDPTATDHADKIRAAALMITDILENVDRDSYAGNERAQLTQLRKQAKDINAQTLTLNQKEDVRDFFATARNILAKMS
ncbi:MAG: hypothetical protein WBA17_00405 [Saprospiraceae bacterium]